jgi:hypothetical protein
MRLPNAARELQLIRLQFNTLLSTARFILLAAKPPLLVAVATATPPHIGDFSHSNLNLPERKQVQK